MVFWSSFRLNRWPRNILICGSRIRFSRFLVEVEFKADKFVGGIILPKLRKLFEQATDRLKWMNAQANKISYRKYFSNHPAWTTYREKAGRLQRVRIPGGPEEVSIFYGNIKALIYSLLLLYWDLTVVSYRTLYSYQCRATSRLDSIHTVVDDKGLVGCHTQQGLEYRVFYSNIHGPDISTPHFCCGRP